MTRTLKTFSVIRVSIYLYGEQVRANGDADFGRFLERLHVSPLKPDYLTRDDLVVDQHEHRLYATCPVDGSTAHTDVAAWVRSELLNVWQQVDVTMGFLQVARSHL